MGLFPDPVPTQEEITRQQVIEMNAWVDGTVQISKDRLLEMFNRFWNNPKCTPQEMSDAYGSYAVELFQKFAIWIGGLQAIDPSFIPPQMPDKYTYVINQDGTITITEKVTE